MSFSKIEKEFLSTAQASVLLPKNTHTPLSELLQRDSEDFVTIQSIEQRDILFFDELLPIYVVLRVPQCSEDELKKYLSRLELKIEGWATNEKQDPSPASSTAKDILFTEEVKHDEDPIVLISQMEGEENVYLNLMWEVSVRISRPRSRIQAGLVTLVPTALVKPVENLTQKQIFLEQFQPQPENLFEPLRGSRGYEHDVPYLPVSRLDTVLPQPPKDDHTFHIRCIPSQPIPTHLAFVTRLKYSKPSIHDAAPSTIALLDIEIIPFIKIRGQIIMANMELLRGRVASLTGNMLPMDCQSRDCITFLYRLEKGIELGQTLQSGTSGYVDSLNVTIKIELGLSEECRSEIQMNWTTNIDFAQFMSITADGLGSSTRFGAPQNLSIDGIIRDAYQPINVSLQQILPSNGPKIVSISFAAPEKSVQIGVPFSWQVLIVNRTDKAAKLAILPLPRIQKPTTQVQQYAKRHATKSSVASVATSDKHASDRQQSDIAQAVMDENVLYAMQHSGAVPPETDLMSLTSELRIGPLGPGQCHEGEIRFIAFKSGAFTLEAIRVVDLVKEVEQGYGGPGVVMDIRELPDIIVEDTKEAE